MRGFARNNVGNTQFLNTCPAIHWYTTSDDRDFVLFDFGGSVEVPTVPEGVYFNADLPDEIERTAFFEGMHGTVALSVQCDCPHDWCHLRPDSLTHECENEVEAEVSMLFEPHLCSECAKRTEKFEAAQRQYLAFRKGEQRKNPWRLLGVLTYPVAALFLWYRYDTSRGLAFREWFWPTLGTVLWLAAAVFAALCALTAVAAVGDENRSESSTRAVLFGLKCVIAYTVFAEVVAVHRIAVAASALALILTMLAIWVIGGGRHKNSTVGAALLGLFYVIGYILMMCMYAMSYITAMCTHVGNMLFKN